MMTTPHLGEAGPHPVVASAARELLNKSENERYSVISPYSQTIGNADALSPVVERARLPPEARVTPVCPALPITRGGLGLLFRARRLRAPRNPHRQILFLEK